MTTQIAAMKKQVANLKRLSQDMSDHDDARAVWAMADEIMFRIEELELAQLPCSDDLPLAA